MGKIKCICPVCGKTFYQHPSRVRQGVKRCSNKCRGKSMRGENNKNYVNGYSINQWGYKMINVDGKKVYEHRHIWEINNGPIPKGCEIHHIDGNKLNNDIANLKLVSIEEHKKFHRDKITGRFISRVIEKE